MISRLKAYFSKIARRVQHQSARQPITIQLQS